jgi:hypothetical protein
MRARKIAVALHSMTALLLATALMPAAYAKDVRIAAPAPAGADAQPVAPLAPAESALLGRALQFDPADPSGGSATAKPLRARQWNKWNKPAPLAVSRNVKPDGSSTVAVKKPLAADIGSAGLDADVGADVNVAAPPATAFEPGRPLPGAATNDAGSGAAWASVGLHNLASVDARVDPVNDQGRLAGTLKHSVPIGKTMSVTLQDSYSVTQPLSAAPDAAAPPSTTAAAPTQTFGNERSVKLDVKPTGTSFSVALATASNDPVTHRTLSADQKLYGPLHVTTAVTDLGQPSENKSITAGFKIDW